jgi:hypothetical protein
MGETWRNFHRSPSDSIVISWPCRSFLGLSCRVRSPDPDPPDPPDLQSNGVGRAPKHKVWTLRKLFTKFHHVLQTISDHKTIQTVTAEILHVETSMSLPQD